MKPRVLLTPAARADLEDIWDFTEKNWGIAKAEAYTREIWQGMEALVQDPRRGIACDDLRAGYRKLTVGSHVVFYRLADVGIDVVRILHARRDFRRLL